MIPLRIWRKMLGDADTIEIEAKASQALTKEILKTIPGIEQTSVKASGEEGVAAAVIREKKGEDIRGESIPYLCGKECTPPYSADEKGKS